MNPQLTQLLQGKEDNVFASRFERAISPTKTMVVVGMLGVLIAGYFLLAAPSADAGAGTCRGEQVTISGTPGNDNLNGTSGRDVISGKGGNDDIEGRGGNDLICGGGGNDDLEGESGDDRLYGGGGNDDLSGDGGNDVLHGGSGFDEADGDAGTDNCKKVEEQESC